MLEIVSVPTYDPIMCWLRPANTPSPNVPSFIVRPHLTMWEAALRDTQTLLPSIRSRITYPGSPKIQIRYVEDVDENWSSDITHVTDNAYGPSAVFEPYPCTIPDCEEQFSHGATVLEFYLHMEEAPHANRLFETSSHTCPFGCTKGFISAYPFL
jgi:hypothetical protein